jgi:hypothetical protein
MVEATGRAKGGRGLAIIDAGHVADDILSYEKQRQILRRKNQCDLNPKPHGLNRQ